MVAGLQVAAQPARRFGVQLGEEHLGLQPELGPHIGGEFSYDLLRGSLLGGAFEEASQTDAEYVADGADHLLVVAIQ